MPDLGDELVFGGYNTVRGGLYRTGNVKRNGRMGTIVGARKGRAGVKNPLRVSWTNPITGAVAWSKPSERADRAMAKKYGSRWTGYKEALKWDGTWAVEKIPGSKGTFKLGQLKRRPNSFSPWTTKINQYMVNPEGQTVENPEYLKALQSLKAGSKTKKGKIGWLFKPQPTLASQYNESRASRALQTGNYLDQTALADATYRQGANERQLRSDAANIDYADAKRKLAEKSIGDRSLIDSRAAKAGVAFSQGRLNAQNSYTKSLAEDLASRNAGFTKNMFSIGAEDASAVALREASKRAALNSSVDVLRQQDQAYLSTNTPVAYRTSAKYPELRKRGKDWVPYNPKTRQYDPRPQVMKTF